MQQKVLTICFYNLATQPMSEPLELLDNDYAALIAGEYDPNLEPLMRAAGESPTDTLVLTELVGLAQKVLSPGIHPEAAQTGRCTGASMSRG